VTGLTGVLPALAPAWTRRTEDVHRRPRARVSARRRVVVGEALFRGALQRERHRADRFNQPAVVTLIAPAEGTAADPGFWQAATRALLSATRETDVVGWYAAREVLAVILAESDLPGDELARAFEARVRSRFVLQGGRPAASLSVRVHVHGPNDGKTALPLAPDSLVAPLQVPRAATPVRDGLKRALDVVGSLALLVLFSPVFLALAALIKLTSPGPVFFRQERIGLRRERFTMLKFRSMRIDADPAIHREFVTQFIRAGVEAQDGPDGAVFKLTKDPRVTPIGRFLRRTSLDELPQFWNVLRGDMSLVGPRPPLAYELEQYRPWHFRRVLDAKPGITGLWQVTGRSRTTFDEMVRLDLRYARTSSLREDLRILLATPRAMISGKGAC
jgi:lipopolysaccharide/colanic/teichoic acid biosynthesis glycosyltransferase